MARVVVLGGRGFIGANLVNRLHRDGHDVSAVDSGRPSFRPLPAGVKHRTLDLTKQADAFDALDDADWVFHLAASMGGVGWFHSDKDWSSAVINGKITHNVLSALQADQRLFYASSACAYPTELQMGIVAPRLFEKRAGMGTPDALYGAEKLHGLRLCSKMPNARVGILHTVYGPLQEHEGPRMKFPAAVATKALAARKTGRLELWGDGTQKRSYLYVDDAVEKIVRIMEADDYDGPVNVGFEGAVRCIDVAKMCLDLAGVPDAEIVLNPAEPSGVRSRDCDNRKFNRLYGAVPQTSVREGFARFMAWLEGR